MWIVVFPFFKIAMKKWLWTYSRRLEDISTDVTVCLVEISGALYQSVCMQLMESLTAALLLMAMDFVQAALEVWMYTSHGFLVDGTSTVATAVKIVESSLFPGTTEDRVSRAPSSSCAPTTRAYPLIARTSTWQSFGRSSQRGSVATTTAASAKVASTSADDYRQSQQETRIANRRRSCPNVYVARSPNSVFLTPVDFERKSSLSGRRLLNLRRHSVIRSRGRTSSGASTSTATTSSSPVSTSRDDASTRFPNGVHTVGRPRSNVQIDNVYVTRKDQARILEQTLQLLFSCEVLLFVEYIEMVIPLIYTLIATVTWHLPNAQYNTVICTLSRDQMLQGFQYSVLYAALEAGTFVAMCLAMKRKFGIRTCYQLAFVLETYAMTLQGKLIGGFIVIVNLAIVHQGVDVSRMMSGRATADRSGCGFHFT